jgi:alkylation response protein AidB-like acyl-CoA dehydrogenase
MTDSVITRPDLARGGASGFEDLRRAASESSELARELAATTEQQRSLAPEVVTKLKDSGLLRTGLPSGLGGVGVPPAVVLETAETIARGDASTGWCVSIAVTSSLLGAYVSPEAGREIFGDPKAVAAGVWAPRAKGRKVSGGVVVSGQWSFCSGITHADWMFGGFMLAGAEGEAPVIRTAAFPKSDLRILDTWHTSGLRGTGSHDSVADEVFVPDHRVFSVMDGPPEGAEPLHRFPVFGFFALSIAAAALGNARGAIDELVELATSKVTLGSSRSIAERSQTQTAVAQAEAALRAARGLYYQAIDDAWVAAQEPEPVSESLRMGLRLAASHATRTAADVTASMYDLGGGSAIYEKSPLQRRFRDAHTATAHFQVNPASFELTGRILLGLPTNTAQL